MSKKTLIIGNGRWSKVIQRVLHELGQDFIVSTHEWQNQISNTAKAIIATPAKTHFYIANELLRHKIPVLIEKPAVLTLEHSEILEHHSNLTETPVFCHTPYLYHTLIEQLKNDFKNSIYINYVSYRANIEGNHRDGNSFINHGPHDLANLWYLGIRNDIKIDNITKTGNLIKVEAFNSQGHFNFITGEQQLVKTRYLIVNDGTYNNEVQIVDDYRYIKNGFICPEYQVIGEPLKQSLMDFIKNKTSKCGIEFIKWSSKVLEQLKDI